MVTIDADAHVIESERTWDFIDEPLRAHRPMLVVPPNAPAGPDKEFWLVDGRVNTQRRVSGRDTAQATRELLDVEARLRHMDELGVDAQVVYPSFFLAPITTRPEVELAVCRGYNRFMAQACAQSRGRLQWVVVPPLLSMDEALEELRWAKEQGACGVFMRGIEGERRVCDPYFFPLYAVAEQLDLAIGYHSAAGNFAFYQVFLQESGICQFKLPIVGAFHALVANQVPERFPNLRFGFIEASAQWVPYIMHDLARRSKKKGFSLPKNLLQEYRLYVACQTDDDLPYVLKYTGEDNLVIGSDYGHTDHTSELDALKTLKEMGEVDGRVIDKILDDNVRALYGIHSV